MSQRCVCTAAVTTSPPPHHHTHTCHTHEELMIHHNKCYNQSCALNAILAQAKSGRGWQRTPCHPNAIMHSLPPVVSLKSSPCVKHSRMQQSLPTFLLRHVRQQQCCCARGGRCATVVILCSTDRYATSLTYSTLKSMNVCEGRLIEVFRTIRRLGGRQMELYSA